MKKITKFLDSVMGGIKRTCVAKALAVFAVASIAISSFAQTLEGANPVINGVEDFKGLTLADLEKASTSTNFSFADKAKVLFLYNVKTGKFLNVGGYWGTCAGLHDYGKALWVDFDGTNFKFTMNNGNDTGNTLGLVLDKSSETDNGVFVDRGKAVGETALCNWTIVPVVDAQNTVRIFAEKKTARLWKMQKRQVNTISVPTLTTMVQTEFAMPTRMVKKMVKNSEKTANGASSPTIRYTRHSKEA